MRAAKSYIYRFSNIPETFIKNHPVVQYIQTNELAGPVKLQDQELLNVFPKTSLS